MVLNRDGRLCRLKLDGCTRTATHVHHTVGREVSGDNPAHLLAACQNCNLKVGDPRLNDPAPSINQWW